MEASMLSFESRIEQLNRFASLTVQPAANVAQKGDSDNNLSNNNSGGRGNSRCGFRGGRRGRGRGPNGRNVVGLTAICVRRQVMSFLIAISDISSSGISNLLVQNRDSSHLNRETEVEDGQRGPTASYPTASMNPTANPPIAEIAPRASIDDTVSASRDGSCAPTTSLTTSPQTDDNGPSNSESSSAQSGSTQSAIQSSTIEAQAPQQQHHMVTRAKLGIHKPKYPYVGLLQTETPVTLEAASEPRSVSSALSQPHWKKAMLEELQALQRNGTWILVPYDGRQKVVDSKWVFKTKYKPDGSILKFKARLVAKGFQQAAGVDFDIAYSVNKLSQFMSDPTDEHYQGVKRIFRYLKGTHNLGLHICPLRASILSASLSITV
ncbi:Retrovirus-related Pol polyprotein from transposon TNT 1-94 [Senna tora]|uniref:Retrovirus-related Pol polyprotein from transposon TNT 1-94 n=1 Tax=Senna tora TaxID=362788 RepID=A0A835CKJ9_9FABA|nr:Retrovirus-related Pol polyprotein from transposon TNT 1-94 [Senna tora]